MSPTRDPYFTFSLRFPRVSGDEPKVVLESVVGGLFSPRERG